MHGLFLADLSETGCDLPRATLAPFPLAAEGIGGDAAEPTGPIALLDVLGVGSTSVVFRARINGVDCAVKCLQGAGSQAAHELLILRRLRDNRVPGIAGIAYEAVETSIVITSPVGERLAIRAADVSAALAIHRAKALPRPGAPGHSGRAFGRPDANQLQQLGVADSLVLINARIFGSAVDSLHSAHRCGVLHGDPRLANLAAVPLPPAHGTSDVFPCPSADPRGGASVAAVAASETPPVPQAQAVRVGLVLDFGYGHLGKTVPQPHGKPEGGTFFEGTAGIKAWAAAYAFRYDAIGVLPQHVWVSLPYASRRQLIAFATGGTHYPEPSDDLFILGASLYRLLVPWAPAASIQTTEDALLLAAYWDCLMAGGSATDTSSGDGCPSLWGHAFLCAEAYDVGGFKVAVALAVQGTVPDWPWGGSAGG